MNQVLDVCEVETSEISDAPVVLDTAFQQAWDGQRSIVPVDAEFVTQFISGRRMQYRNAPTADAPYEYASYAFRDGSGFVTVQDVSGGELSTIEVRAVDVPEYLQGLTDPSVVEGVLLDDAGSLVTLRLTAELGSLVAQYSKLKSSDQVADQLAMLKLAARVSEIMALLGRAQLPDAVASTDTSSYFEFDEHIKPSARQKKNKAAMALLKQIDAGEIDAETLSAEQKTVLAGYSGNGGGMTGADGKTGSQYEYYTPKPLAEGVWSLMADMGFTGGKVLDPAAGTGIFGATSPQHAVIDAVELDATSGRVNQLVNGSARNHVTVSAFEAVAANTPDEIYDAVVTNVPFGDNAARGKEKLKDPRYQSESLEAYFILRSLEKLRPRGLACFITSKAFVSSVNEQKLRYKASLKAEFMGAYRLPNKMFDATGADVTTDVIVFRKYSSEAVEKIEELQQQDPDKLHVAGVLWDEFLAGGYFKGAGRRFMLGETTMDKGRFGEVEKVISDDSIGNISKLLRRFGESRIDWDSLNAAPALPISYSDGDAIAVAGRTMVYQNGVFAPVKQSPADAEMVDMADRLYSPLRAVNQAATWSDASRLYAYMIEKADYQGMPAWVKDCVVGIDNAVSLSEQAAVFDVLKTALALRDVVNQHAPEEPFNYAEVYPQLGEAIKSQVKSVRAVPSGISKVLRDAAALLGIWYNVKTRAFSNRWMGTSLAEVAVAELAPTQKYERAKYEHADDAGFIALAHLKEALSSDFDPMAGDAWCISPDGQSAMSAEDYYAGNYADFLKRNTAEIEAVTDPAIRDKLVRQRQAADDRLVKPDVSALTMNLATPFVELERKAEFLRKYLHPGFAVVSSADGPVIGFEGTKGKMADEDFRNLKRYAEYVKSGGLSTRTKQEDKAIDSTLEPVRIERLKQLITQTNQKFDAWTKANTSIQASLKSQFERPDNLFFREVDDTTPLEIPGLNPAFQPHGYQNATIRRYAKRMGGILGFDVGLGKTFTSLTTVQHIQSIGVKKKTFFVVPNSTLTNWQKETKSCYASTEDCLFVGLETAVDGSAQLNSGNYARDLNIVLENRHRKIFMTLEAFAMIQMRTATLEEYESHLKQHDASYDGDETKSKAASIIKEGKLAGVTKSGGKGSAAVPFFEDMGVDSLVFDEGHTMKNSKTTVDFKGAKFLSAPVTSDRGLDAQIKTWYVRGKSKLGDGVLVLTATPITNSPLEIYAMLTLAVGEQEVNRRMGGVRGADAFMEAFCNITEEETTSLSGTERLSRVFRGLQNTALLRDVLGQIANIKTAKEVDLSIPEAQELPTAVELPEAMTEELKRMQRLYSTASRLVRETPVSPHEQDELFAYLKQSRETPELVAHPFNFINKVSKLIADPETARQTSVYLFPASQVELAQLAVDQFNAKKVTEERNRPTLMQSDESVVKRTIKKGGGDGDGADVEVLTVRVVATIDGDKIVIDTESQATQNVFQKIATVLKLDLDVTIPPKLAAFLGNFQQEQATPKAGGKAKQLVFCDMLALHNKIRIMLGKRCGIPSGAIAIVNAEAIKDAGQMQDVQDGFNAEGEQNRFTVVIANKKAEVGINLQKGTQAIHHLTVGWTPDSLHQRNGRGVRQGNKLQSVTIYHYDADGTFDEYKRGIVSKKADWIGELMSGKGNSVKIAGGISNQDVEMLAEAAGSAEGMRAVREKIASREAVERQRSAKDALTANLSTMMAQREVVARYPTVGIYLGEQVADAAEAYFKLTAVKGRYARYADAKDPAQTARIAELLSKAQAVYDRIANPIKASIAISPDSRLKTLEEAFGQTSWIETARGSQVIKGINRNGIMSSVASSAGGNRYTSFQFSVVDESPIAQNWDAETTTARVLADESEAKALSLCADAGVSLGRIEQAKTGEAKIIRNQIVGTGDFVIDRKDRLWIVEDGKTSSVRTIDAEAAKLQRADESIVFSGNIITQEHPDNAVYRATVLRAAAVDDGLIARAQGGLNAAAIGLLYSALNSDVKAALKVGPRINALPDEVTLPEPMFPLVLKPRADQSLPLIKRIAAEQEGKVEYVTDQHGTVRVLVPDDATVERYNKPSLEKTAKMLLRYGIAQGMKVSAAALKAFHAEDDADLVAALVRAVNGVIGTIDYTTMESAIEAATTSEELVWLCKQAYMSYYAALDWDDAAINAHYRETFSVMVNAAYRRKSLALTQPVPTPAAEIPVITSYDVQVPLDKYVAIIGNTMAFKDTIKSVALTMGFKAMFRGKWPSRQLQSAPVNSWVVPREVYEIILRDYAEQVRTYNISIA
ncbi:SNF2-related protein [Collimonas sp. OK412]|uniref:SNF2-related protein n=1 Tax=Collimonas sp. (strain OK412) TaxID=1801619 RepID=UPI0008EB5DE1|nr:SNF2-related protein [Collimonas sp. OK412]SFB69144.1 Helicase conserved C-terminal domain-containing protein [Collimonas sp. OK412]